MTAFPKHYERILPTGLKDTLAILVLGKARHETGTVDVKLEYA
jgi:hypothetical protein